MSVCSKTWGWTYFSLIIWLLYESNNKHCCEKNNTCILALLSDWPDGGAVCKAQNYYKLQYHNSYAWHLNCCCSLPPTFCPKQNMEELMKTDRPDWQSVMQYVSQIYKYFETWPVGLKEAGGTILSPHHCPSRQTQRCHLNPLSCSPFDTRGMTSVSQELLKQSWSCCFPFFQQDATVSTEAQIYKDYSQETHCPVEHVPNFLAKHNLYETIYAWLRCNLLSERSVWYLLSLNNMQSWVNQCEPNLW